MSKQRQRRPQNQRHSRHRLPNADKPSNSSQLKALASKHAWRGRRKRSKWFARLSKIAPLPPIWRILQAAGRSTSSIIQNICSLGTNVRTVGTIYQRSRLDSTNCLPLPTRKQSGNPDFVDAFWARNRGGPSKCSPVVNLSEDIFAGYSVMMRGEASPHIDFVEFESGREFAFNTATEFFQAIAGKTPDSVGVISSFFQRIRSLTTTILRVDRWCILDCLCDLTTVTLSFVDIVCDVTVLMQYRAKGYYGLFKAGCFIFVVAQLTYAFLFVCMYPPRKDTNHARIALFFKILPVAQLVPFFIWLQSFQIPAINQCLQWLDTQVPGSHTPSKDSHKTCEYMRKKFEKHSGFIGEAFSEAIPQCLLQTAAICMYPELASPLSIYSILASISVVASKGYLFSYAAHLPTRVFNMLCIIADLLNAFATASWLFASPSNLGMVGRQQPFILNCFIRATRHGCLGAVACFMFLICQEVWNDRRTKRKTEDPWQVFFVFVQLLLFLLPGVVVLATLKLSILPLCIFGSFRAFDPDNDAAFGFEDKLTALLSSRLSQAERERRICLVNVFSLFAEARVRDGTSSRFLPKTCLEDTCRYMFYREFKPQHAQFSTKYPSLTQDPVLSLIEPAAKGIPALRSECKRRQTSWAALSTSFLPRELSELLRKCLVENSPVHAGVPSISTPPTGAPSDVQLHHAWRHTAHQHWESYTDDFQYFPESFNALWQEIKYDVVLVLGAIYHHWMHLWSLGWLFCRKCLHIARKLSDMAHQCCLRCFRVARDASNAGNQWDTMLLVSAVLSGALSATQLFYFAGYTVLFVGQAMLYPIFRIGIQVWSSDKGSMDIPDGIQRLQTVLSTGFALCLIALIALFPSITTRHRDFIFFLRPGQLPGNFFRPPIADAMREACDADARCLQTYRSLIGTGLPSGVCAEVMAFVGPSCMEDRPVAKCKKLNCWQKLVLPSPTFIA